MALNTNGENFMGIEFYAIGGFLLLVPIIVVGYFFFDLLGTITSNLLTSYGIEKGIWLGFFFALLFAGITVILFLVKIWFL
ncbi:hypothetical protein [Enterococcus sp. LJL90]